MIFDEGLMAFNLKILWIAIYKILNLHLNFYKTHMYVSKIIT